jgi:hypothetical protein
LNYWIDGSTKTKNNHDNVDQPSVVGCRAALSLTRQSSYDNNQQKKHDKKALNDNIVVAVTRKLLIVRINPHNIISVAGSTAGHHITTLDKPPLQYGTNRSLFIPDQHGPHVRSTANQHTPGILMVTTVRIIIHDGAPEFSKKCSSMSGSLTLVVRKDTAV